MRSLIEEYRGFEIYFNTETEKFYTISNQHDVDMDKNTYASTKTYIDKFIKDNVDFKPFYVVDDGTKRYKVTGIRKDGKFNYQNSEGKMDSFSNYDLDKYILENDLNVPIFEQIRTEKEIIKMIEIKIKSLKESLIKVTLKDIKSKYTI